MSTNDTGTNFVATTRLIFVGTPRSAAIQSVHRGVFEVLQDAGLKEGVDYDFNIKFYKGHKGAERRLCLYLTDKAVKDLGDYYAKFIPIVRKCAVPLFIESSPNPYTASPYTAALPPNDAVISYLSDAYAEALMPDPTSAGVLINPEMVAAFFATVEDDKCQLFKETGFSFDLSDKDNVEQIKADLGIRNTFIQLADVRYVPDKGIEVDINIPGRPVTTHVYNNIAKSVIAKWRT